MLPWLRTIRQRRVAALLVVNLRILVGFAFLPAGLKKTLYQPFTDPSQSGAFHDFLHAFYATGPFYQFVGVVQLVIAALLMTQRFAALGAALALPVLAAITAFCWSTAGAPTVIVVTLMLLATLGLLAWDFDRWAGLVVIDRAPPPPPPENPPPIDIKLWSLCGAAILLFYLATCVVAGGVYRPKGADFANPAFYVLPLIAAFPLLTLLIERRARRQSARR